jgi:hypothetical protein
MPIDTTPTAGDPKVACRWLLVLKIPAQTLKTFPFPKDS